MTETMKKTNEAIARFKPPFEATAGGLFVGCGKIIEDANRNPIGEANTKEEAELMATALNFYYANKRERGERKGEKE